MEEFSRQAAALAPQLTAWRRDLHRFPEKAWTEFRTASLIARHLQDTGWRICLGREALKRELPEFVPDEKSLAAEQARAVAEGADPSLVERMSGGHTALWADLPCSDGAGPLLAFRFDTDAVTIDESLSPEHRPRREGFASCRPGVMHACGHDGHTAIGLGLAELLPRFAEELRGTVRLIFQPAEEGGGGAGPMLAAGAVRDVNFLVGLHVGIQQTRTGGLACGSMGFLASTGFDILYSGKAAHAGLAPQDGRNALLAACSAGLALHALPRHSGGASRVNVGRIQAGQARNVIADHALLEAETRGATTEIDDFISGEALRAARAAGEMWNCSCEILGRKKIPGGDSSPVMCATIEEIARAVPAFTHIAREQDFGATEDFTILLEDVQKRGGQGTYIQLGAELAAGHHSPLFDFDEAALPLGLELLARIARFYLSPGNSL